MKVFPCAVILVLVFPLSTVSGSPGDVIIPKDDSPLLEAESEVKKIAERSVECSNAVDDCICKYWAMLVTCESSLYKGWMQTKCAAACGFCTRESINSECKNNYPDKTCDMLVKNGFQHMAQFQLFMSCRCAKSLGLCETTAEPDTVEPTPEDTIDVEEECLKIHNQIRIHHHAEELSWCTKCAEFAQEVVDKLQDSNEPMEHASREERTWLVNGELVVHGESLQYESEPLDCKGALHSWYSESELYDPHNPVTSMLEDAAHFTQMVWKDTKSVGCAKSRNYVACIYEPTGNIKNAYEIERNVQP
ncbi:ectin-like [Branchiostoma floridae x Branchiostoma japonicum]